MSDRGIVSGSVSVDVRLRPVDGVQPPPSAVYLFDHDGALVDSKPLGEGPFELTLSDERRHRLLLGPAVSVDRSGAAIAADLRSSGAISRDVFAGGIVTLTIPPSIYRCWWETCIFVHGSVRKQTGPGVYVPICTGTVQIFQVDLGCTLDQLASFTDAPKWYALLTDVLAGLDRALLAERIRLIPNLPDPPPDPFREIGVIRALPSKTAVQSLAHGRMIDAAVVSSGSSAAAGVSALTASSPAELAAVLKSLPQSAVRSTILANKEIVAPYLCSLIPDEWFCWQELGEATIQSDGTFSAEICFWCPADFPDLYFEVVQTIDGIEREISDPQIACSTYYGYDGTQDVVITVDDPAAVACNEPQQPPIGTGDYYVWPNAIGNVNLRFINGIEDPPAATPPQGLLGASPWGGTLALQMQFDPRLRTDGVAEYYRWSYLFDGDSVPKPLTAPVVHRYMTVTFSPLVIHLHNYPLGPQTIAGRANLFEIPPDATSLGGPTAAWVNINDPADRPSGYFDSTDNHYPPFSYTDALPRRSGMCTLLLEMFDSAGAFVPCGNNGVGGPFVFVLPDLTTPDQYTSVLGANNITADGRLQFRVLIDNNDTFASIDSVTVNGNTGDACGIRHYTSMSDNVAIAFRATHPNDYLGWGLSVSLGFYGGVASESGSSSSPPAPQNPFIRTAGQLLDPGGCTNGAFAVNLGADATATDGYGNQEQYDRSASVAFALLNP